MVKQFERSIRLRIQADNDGIYVTGPNRRFTATWMFDHEMIFNSTNDSPINFIDKVDIFEENFMWLKNIAFLLHKLNTLLVPKLWNEILKLI